MSLTEAWSKFQCPVTETLSTAECLICTVPCVLYEDVESRVQLLAHGEIDLFCWLPEWEVRWGKPVLWEVLCQFHGAAMPLRARLVLEWEAYDAASPGEHPS